MTDSHPIARRAVAPALTRLFASAVLVAALGLTGLQAVAQTLPVIQDQPLFTVSSVQPNVMLTLDNSGSMNWQFAPMSTAANQSRRCFNNSSYNRLYFNPSATYLPPMQGNGTRLPDASYAAAFLDGFRTGAGTRSLSTGFPALGNYAAYTQGNSNTEPRNSNGPANRGAYYYAYTGASPATPVVGTCYPDASYTLVDMNAASAAQQTNFANWFSYYRSRVNAMKTSAGEAFRVVDSSFRVGLHTINNPNGSGATGAFLPLATFDATMRNTWYTRFYEIQPNGGTPLVTAQERIGEYYRAGTSPSGAAVPDPIQYSCQQNYHLLTTDGQWNGTGATGARATTNYDRTLPSGNPDLLTALGSEFNTTFAAGANWPAPYRENATTSSVNNLSDLAAYYWMTDLRPTMPNNVFTSSVNPAFWQHMVTFGLAFSEQGNIAYPNGVNAIAAGTAQWPVPVADSASAVDDLWHSALIGHGQFFSVASPAELTGALGRAITEIQSRAGSNSGAVLTGSDFAQGSPVAFRAQYQSGEWTGDLQARNVDAATGAISSTAVWRAKDKLEDQVLPAGPGGGWLVNRKIVTRTSSGTAGTAVRFREPGASGAGGNITAAQALTLDADPTKSRQVLEYLRGDRTNEDTVSTTLMFRRRTAVLADLVNSEPRYVGKPVESYSDAYHPGYASFQTSKAARTPTLYVGSNGGMLHAFKGTVGDADSGQEKWAYVPSFMFGTGVDGLAGLTWRTSDPVPLKFEHRYRVDQTPTVRDVDFARVGGTGGGGDWRTLLVSGLNKGGKGYFALDVTNPDAATEDALRSKVLWEFDGSQTGDTSRVGFSFGQPLVIYTNAGWMVAVSSGYQNATGTGHIWLLDPRDGSVIKRLDAGDNGGASASSPVGLAHMEVFFESDREQRAQQLYATDLKGNVWRFDLSAAAVGSWPSTGTKIASVGAPITTAPAIAINPRDRSERWVFFGTGQMLSTADMSVTTTRTFYAFKDGGSAVPGVFTSPLTRADLQAVSPSGFVTTGSGVKGWYMDMSSGGGGQVIAPPYVSRGVVMWTTTVPTGDACSPGANGVFYAREIGAASNRIMNGSPYVTVNAPVTKIQVAQGTEPSGGTSTQRRQLMIASTANSDIVVDVNLRVVLTGGRSNLRLITNQ